MTIKNRISLLFTEFNFSVPGICFIDAGATDADAGAGGGDGGAGDGSGDGAGDGAGGSGGAGADGAGDGSGDGAGTASWMDGLSEGLRDHPDVKRYTSIDAMATGLISANKMIGKDKIPLPTEHSTEEEWGNVYDKLGRPGTKDDYTLEFKSGIKDAKADPDVMEAFKDISHKIGLNGAQAQSLYSWYTGIAEEAAVAGQEHHQSAEDTLRGVWGNDYDKHMTVVNQLLTQFGDETVTEAFENGWGDDPAMVYFLTKLGYAMAESPEPGMGDGKGADSASIEAEIATYTSDLKGPYHNRSHTNHKQAVAHVNSLFEKLRGKDTILSVNPREQ